MMSRTELVFQVFLIAWRQTKPSKALNALINSIVTQTPDFAYLHDRYERKHRVDELTSEGCLSQDHVLS